MDTFPLGSILLWIYIPVQVATFCTISEAEGVRIVLDGYFANAIPDKVCSCVAQKGQAKKIVFSNVNFLQSPIQDGAWCGSKIIAKQDNGESNHMSCRVLGSLNLQDDNDIQIILRKESEPEDTRYCALVYFDTDEPIKISCFSNYVTTTSMYDSSIISTTDPSTMISSYSAETTTVDMLKETSTTLTSQHETVSNSILMDTITPIVSTTHLDPHTATTVLLTENATVELKNTETTTSVEASTKKSITLTDVKSDTPSSTPKALQTKSSKMIDMITTTEPTGTSREMSIQMTEMTSVQSTPFTFNSKSSTEISKSPSTGSTPVKTTERLTTQYHFTNTNITPTEYEVSANVSLDITRNTTHYHNVSSTTDIGTTESSTSAFTESTNTRTPYIHMFSVTTESTAITDTSMLFETTTKESTSMKNALETSFSTSQLSSDTTTDIIAVTKNNKSTDSSVKVTASTVEGLRTTDPSKTESSFNTPLITQDSTMNTRSTTKINTTVPPEPTTTLVNDQTVDDKNLYIGIGVGCGVLVIIIIILIGASIRKKHLTSKGIELKSYLHGEDNDYTTVNVTHTSVNNQTNGINFTNGQADMSSKHKPDCSERDEYKPSAAKHIDIPNIKPVDSLYAVVDKSKKKQLTNSVIGGVKGHTAAEKTTKPSQETETTTPDTANNNGLQYAELEFSYQPSTTAKPNVTNNDSVDYAEVMFKN
ncbi:uncharacterized protein LOC143082243 isoform X1 [Mytilus galloprovincialis]|uniref:uncharacterized protein LOC143082243 isoform X1 n=2 Tax=Mytilus galloprovincialis TaxID=29158 RepID=UPI003F7B8072